MNEGDGRSVIVVQTRSAYHIQQLDQQTVVSYSLALPLVFGRENYYARLVQVTGFPGDLVVFADFVSDTATSFNGQSAQFLGISPSSSLFPLWVPVASNFVPAVGNLFLENALADTPVPLDLDITLVIEIVPSSWLQSRRFSPSSQ